MFLKDHIKFTATIFKETVNIVKFCRLLGVCWNIELKLLWLLFHLHGKNFIVCGTSIWNSCSFSSSPFILSLTNILTGILVSILPNPLEFYFLISFLHPTLELTIIIFFFCKSQQRQECIESYCQHGQVGVSFCLLRSHGMNLVRQVPVVIGFFH